MRVSIVTKLTLYDFARILGINPIHIAQVTFQPTGSHANTLCDQAYFQYNWQDHDRISREDMARAIQEAEEILERHLGYRLLPAWEVDERQQTGRLSGGNWAEPVRADWGHFIAGGQRATTLLGANRPIVWSDADGDAYKETATVTATVDAGTDPCEVHAFYPLKSGAAIWEIRPVSVSIAGTTATITFRRELAVLEALQEKMYPDPVAGETDANFLVAVDVYRVWNDPQTQATLMWEPNIGGGCGCAEAGGCATCSYAVQTACLYVAGDPKNSILGYNPSEWIAEDANFSSLGWSLSRRPDVVRLYYYAGFQDKGKACPTVDMSEQWKRTVAHLAASYLDRPPCDCAASEWDYWRQDLALSTGSDANGQQAGFYNISQDDLDSPFGTRRGAIEAWRRVRDPIVKRGFAAMV